MEPGYPASWATANLGGGPVRRSRLISLKDAYNRAGGLHTERETARVALYDAAHTRDAARVESLLTRLREIDHELQAPAKEHLGVELPERVEFEKIRAEVANLIYGRKLVGNLQGVLGEEGAGAAARETVVDALQETIATLQERIKALEQQVRDLRERVRQRGRTIRKQRQDLRERLAPVAGAIRDLGLPPARQNAVLQILTGLVDGQSFRSFLQLEAFQNTFQVMPPLLQPNALAVLAVYQIEYFAAVSGIAQLIINTRLQAVGGSAELTGEPTITFTKDEFKSIGGKPRIFSTPAEVTLSSGDWRNTTSWAKLQLPNLPRLQGDADTKVSGLASERIRYNRVFLEARLRVAIGLVLLHYITYDKAPTETELRESLEENPGDFDQILPNLRNSLTNIWRITGRFKEMVDTLATRINTFQTTQKPEIWFLYETIAELIAAMGIQDDAAKTQLRTTAKKIIARVLLDALYFPKSFADLERDLGRPIYTNDQRHETVIRQIVSAFEIAFGEGNDAFTFGQLLQLGTSTTTLNLNNQETPSTDTRSFYVEFAKDVKLKVATQTFYEDTINPKQHRNLFEVVRLNAARAQHSSFSQALRTLLQPVVSVVPTPRDPTIRYTLSTDPRIVFKKLTAAGPNPELGNADMWQYSTLAVQQNPSLNYLARELRIRMFGIKAYPDSIDDDRLMQINTFASEDSALSTVLTYADKAPEYRKRNDVYIQAGLSTHTQEPEEDNDENAGPRPGAEAADPDDADPDDADDTWDNEWLDRVENELQAPAAADEWLEF